MKEVTVVSFCDNHTEEQVRATHEDVPLMVGESGVRLLDLCDTCYDGLLGPVEALLPFGREQERKERRRRQAQPDVKLQCPLCEMTSVGRKSLGQHLRHRHQASIKNYDVQPAVAAS